MGFDGIEFRGDESVPGFSNLLAELKTGGCNLLVTGQVSERVSARATRTLLGDPAADRKRIVALTDSTTRHVEPCLPTGVRLDSSDVWVIDQRNGERSTPTSASVSDVELPTRQDGQNELWNLAEEIVLAIGFFDTTTDGLEPAGLRLSVDSLSFLAEQHSRTEFECFLRMLTAIIRGVRAMGHYHLPIADDDPLVTELSPLFDARIELRQRDGLVPEQRWHVPTYERSTNWVRL
ncbi:hypothetical protein SAMN05421858_2239 [Haladaptatus litoreus]|uniref:KaiC protein n=1 Tax=Haladaptatus litoreus TaxID=553468 RepID=A0A1N6ZZ61_9EURY|nr:hypothetical protein [Haladaptatus litoreus]SIR32053.1 hypothetical protein SAMN05421858_2239 [Haladaptatus litoreus]